MKETNTVEDSKVVLYECVSFDSPLQNQMLVEDIHSHPFAH